MSRQTRGAKPRPDDDPPLAAATAAIATAALATPASALLAEGRRIVPGPQAAAELVELVRETVAANARREVLHVRLGSLGAVLRRGAGPARRLVREALEPLLASSRLRVFDLPNGDVVAIAPPPAHLLELARTTLARLLEESAAPADLVQPMRLPDAAATLLAAVNESLGLAMAPPLPPPSAAEAAGLAPMDAAALAMAERALGAADLAPFTFNQAVCRLHPDHGPLVPLWQDRRVSLPDLAAAVLPGIDIAAAPALHRRLRRLAESRLLAELAHPSTLSRWQPVGIGLSLASLASPAFQKLDGILAAHARRSVTLGLEAEDILAAPEGFAMARDLARGRGYVLALEEATPALLALLPPARLGLDLVRLRWSPALQRPDAAARAGLAQVGLVHRQRPPGAAAEAPEAAAGPAEVVLTGVDRSAALAWGWEHGITLFQGPLIERRRKAG